MIENFLGFAKINDFGQIILRVPQDVPGMNVIVHPSNGLQFPKAVFNLFFLSLGQF